MPQGLVAPLMEQLDSTTTELRRMESGHGGIPPGGMATSGHFVVQRTEVLDRCGQVTGHFVLFVFDVFEQAFGVLHSVGAV